MPACHLGSHKRLSLPFSLLPPGSTTTPVIFFVPTADLFPAPLCCRGLHEHVLIESRPSPHEGLAMKMDTVFLAGLGVLPRFVFTLPSFSLLSFAEKLWKNPFSSVGYFEPPFSSPLLPPWLDMLAFGPVSPSQFNEASPLGSLLFGQQLTPGAFDRRRPRLVPSLARTPFPTSHGKDILLHVTIFASCLRACIAAGAPSVRLPPMFVFLSSSICLAQTFPS